MSTNPERTLKFIIIGDSGAGKSSLLIRFCQDTFYDQVKATIGFQYLQKTLEVDGRKIKLQIWDTAGQEKYQSITQTFFHGAHGVIFTYSINDENSFKNLQKWMSIVNNSSDKNTIKILVGNKRDDAERRVITTQEAQRFAINHQMQFFETSAKENVNVAEAFYGLAREIKETVLDREENIPVSDNVKLHNKKTVSCWERLWNWFKFW